MSPLGPPPADFTHFPRWTLPTTRALYRIHRRDHDPWFFDNAPTGRFNLSGAFGTCYLALAPEGAFLETLGRQGRLIDPAEVASRALSTLRRSLRKASGGLPKVSTYTIREVLRESGASYQRSRSWCPTGTALRRRKAGPAVVTDPDSDAKKS